MSFLSRLFGRGGAPASSGDKPDGKVMAEIEHKGFTIKAVPYRQNGQFQTAGVIEKEVGGVLKTHRFVRADRSTMVEEVTELALSKGKLMVDEQGEGLFG